MSVICILAIKRINVRFNKGDFSLNAQLKKKILTI